MEKRFELGNKKNWKVGNTGVAPLGATWVFLLSPFRLGLLNRIHPSIRLGDPGDSALRHRRHRRLLLPLSPSTSVADANVGHYRYRLWTLAPPVTSVAAIGRSRRHLQMLRLPPAIVADRCRYRHRRRQLLPLPPPSFSTTNKQIKYLWETKRPILIFISPLHHLTIHHFTIAPLVSLK